MKHTRHSKFFSIFQLLASACLLLASCAPAASSVPQGGNQAWVEFPYEGSTLPMEPLTLVVYASSPEGVSFIQVKVNGQALPAIPVIPLTSDGSSRLVRVDIPYSPASEGEYTVEATAVDSAEAVDFLFAGAGFSSLSFG